MTNDSSTAYDRLLDALESAGKTVRRNVTHADAQCPAHEDREPSMTLTGAPGKVLVHCHVGCDNRNIVSVLGLTMADLYDNPRGGSSTYTPVAATSIAHLTRDSPKAETPKTTPCSRPMRSVTPKPFT